MGVTRSPCIPRASHIALLNSYTKQLITTLTKATRTPVTLNHLNQL